MARNMTFHMLDSYLSSKYSTGMYSTDSIEEFMEEVTVKGISYSYEELVKTYAVQYGNRPEQIKESSPMLVPYSLINNEDKIVKENIAQVHAMVLDIDNGKGSDSCTIEDFMSKGFEFEYYLYTTIKHLLAGGKHRFRVVIPLKNSEPMSVFKERSESIFKFFSNGGKTYVDRSSFAIGRAFIVPVELEHFYKHYQQGEFIDQSQFERSVRFVPQHFTELKVIPGMDDCVEIVELANRYRKANKGDLVEINGESFERNAAFFRIHREIAKYGVSLRRQLELADYMDEDKERGRGTKRIKDTVNNARKTCTTISLAGMKQLRKRKGHVSILKSHLGVGDIKIHKGKSHLILSPPGTGKTHYWMKLFHEDMQIIYAAPQNGIIDQQKLKHPDATICKGESKFIPKERKLLCSYNRVVGMLAGGSDVSNSVVVLDECHRLLTDGFRAGVMSSAVEVLEASDATKVYMSGTFCAADLSYTKFDYIYKFDVKRPMRDVQIVEYESKTVHAILELIKRCGKNVLVLLDDVPMGEVIRTVLHGKAINVFSDSREGKSEEQKKEFSNFLRDETVSGVVLATQVLLEGIDLHGIDDIIIVDNPRSRWGVSQMVQFYGRDRDWKSKCWYLRKPISEEMELVTELPSKEIEREYLNAFYDDASGGFLDIMREDIGAIDVDKLLRVTDGEVYMNGIYPDIKCREYLNIIEYASDYEGLFEEHCYNLIPEVEYLEVGEYAEVDSLEAEIRKDKKEQEQEAIECALEGMCVEGFEDLFGFIRTLLDEQCKTTEQVREICKVKAVMRGYKDRLRKPNSQLEAGIYKEFKVGVTYKSQEIKSKIRDILDVDNLNYVRTAVDHHIKTISRYFITKRRDHGNEILLESKIDVISTNDLAYN